MLLPNKGGKHGKLYGLYSRSAYCHNRGLCRERGGLLEVQPQEVIVLADCAERAKDLDAAAVAKAKADARAAIESGKPELDVEKALIELTLAKSQLDAVNRLKSL